MARDGAAAGIVAWGVGSNASSNVRTAEQSHERLVSAYIGAMPFLWLKVDDEPSASSDRSYIERNLIALLSNCNKVAIDPPTKDWLGNHSQTATIRESGLWNTNHVHESTDSQFLGRFTKLVEQMLNQK
jgi:hypothetical protein